MAKYRVLGMTVNGDMTFCVCPPDKRGVGRCNHIAHQMDGETPEEFVKRTEKIKIKAEKEHSLNFDNSFIQYDDNNEAKIKTTIYRMTDKEKQTLTHIENRMQLDENIEGGYIELEEPLWNDMDKNYFAENYGIPAKHITGILHNELSIVISVDENKINNSVDSKNYRKFKIGRVIDLNSELGQEASKADSEGFIHLGSGVKGMNEYAANEGFTATKDVYVIPYYMRMGVPLDNDKNYDDDDYDDESEEINSCEREMISSDITIGYKYLLRTHKNPDSQQIAYEALLDNTKLDKDKARYNSGYRISSLANEFAGKGGVFRACLSGSSIPYSGRAVISPTIDMKFGEIKVPPTMAVDIWKPTLLKQLSEEGKTVEEISAWIKRYRGIQNEIPKEYRDELEQRISNKRALMNRQPSLHPSSLQSFHPLISDNATVQIHPLYCKAYGADFDGDQVTIYGINSDDIIPIVDKELDAHNEINIRLPRSKSTSSIMPEKDALFGILNILERRSDR